MNSKYPAKTRPRPGVFVLSLDTELAWGNFARVKNPLKKAQMIRTRYCIYQLLDLLETYSIRATWALVGHLMLDTCRPDANNIKHPEAVRPNYRWHRGDWFGDDPCTSLKEDPLWYGKDIVKKILNCGIPQEIASHSFAHQIFGDPGCQRACADSDIRLAVQTAQSSGLQLESFVYPKNSVGYRDILAQYGFRIYRAGGTEWFNRFRFSGLKRILHFIDNLLAIPPAVDVLRQDEYHLFYTSGNMLYQSAEGLRKLIPIRSRVNKAKAGIRRAIAEGKIFHLWFHPFNLSSNPVGLLYGLEEIFSFVKKNVDAGRLVNLPMKELPAYFAEKEHATTEYADESTADYVR